MQYKRLEAETLIRGSISQNTRTSAMAEVHASENLVAVRTLLKTSLKTSRDLAYSLNKNGQRLEGMKQRFPSLEAEVRRIPTRKGLFAAIRDRTDHAIGPAAAVLKIYDAIQELEKSLLSQPVSSDLPAYLLLVRKLEEALKFLSDNCGLAIQWLEDILQFLEDNGIANDMYAINVKKSLRIVQELQGTEKRARLSGGLLFAAFDKLEVQFKQLLTENCIPVPLALFSSSIEKKSGAAPSCLPANVIQKLRAILERLKASDRLKNCASAYVEVRIRNARTSLEDLDLKYLDKSITESDDVQDIEGCTDQWCKHVVLAVRHVFQVEHNLCNDVFQNIGSDVRMDCFSKIAAKSGIVSFLQFGSQVTKCRKDPIKLLKLLDLFSSLDNLRVDFNRLFGAKECVEIQTLTRDLIQRVVNGVCEIFWELPFQVEQQRRSSPPVDGSVPGLVIFVTDYCNQLLGDAYRPLLTKVLEIHHSWKQEKYREEVLSSQIFNIIKEVCLNLDAWSKAHHDTALSYLFMMNNHCHFSNLGGTKLGDMMGNSWLKAHGKCREYYMTLYLRESWGKTFGLLTQEGRILYSPGRGSVSDPVLHSPSRGPISNFVKKRLKAFNESFDALHEKQSDWVVPNEKLRLKMSKLVVQGFVPVYKNYLENYGLSTELVSSPSKYVKYTPQGLETILSSLFQPKVRRNGSGKHTHWVSKIKNIVTDQFRLTLMAA